MARLDVSNNDKVELISQVLGDKYVELGTGTNRVAYLRNNLVVKVALDRRGLADSFLEFKRSPEMPDYLTMTYETNSLILIAEYCTVIDLDQFNASKEVLRSILDDVAENYIFDDIGLAEKNYMNWGYRDNGDLIILDYGYMWPKIGQELALSCPKCKQELRYNSTFTGFQCTNRLCGIRYRTSDVVRRLNNEFSNMENELISKMNKSPMVRFEKVDPIHV
jgi:hypothetical protein